MESEFTDAIKERTTEQLIEDVAQGAEAYQEGYFQLYVNELHLKQRLNQILDLLKKSYIIE